MIEGSTAILLCTYNGALYLKEQVESYCKQSDANWSLFVYDDKSTDDTKEIIKQFKEECATKNEVFWYQNSKNIGFSKNFFNSLKMTPKNFEYYSFSDQDDIWSESKLSRALSVLQKQDKNIPALYCSRTILIDQNGKKIGYSPLFNKPVSFPNSLVQSIAGGNTMVLNRAAVELLCEINEDLDFISHDWFVYQVISGVGGYVFYDPVPEILYRQHDDNVIGSNNGFFAKISRIKKLFSGRYRIWNNKNIEVLEKYYDYLAYENKEKFRLFVEAREETLIPRCIKFLKSGIYRQTLLDNLALMLGVVINKI